MVLEETNYSAFLRVSFQSSYIHRKNIYLFIAILLHALMDFPAALYQMKVTNIFITEDIVFVYFIIAIIFLSKTKKIFSKEVV
ncbi:YhfC family glutamic-type intramembrane protease [Clostridium polyendosporum]|uniref:YhfC family glutamic-type intramembrane protease n=1 Tax=Clostridium polyendosporum TaxID=69208 RepID=UPI003899365D